MNDQPFSPQAQQRPKRGRVVFATASVLIVIAVIVWTRIFFETPQDSTNGGSTQSTPTAATTQYSDSEFGFSLTYPSDWKVERDSTGEGENRIVNIVMGDGSKGITVVVIPVALEGVVRESVSITTESETTINGKQATRIQARTAKDGSSIDLLLFRNRGMLIDLNGPADLVTSIGGTITFEE